MSVASAVRHGSTPGRHARVPRPAAAARFAAGTLLVTLSPAFAPAQEPQAPGAPTEPAAAERPDLITDRPDVTESAAVVPPRLVQVETGALLEREDGGPRTFSGPGTLVRVGVLGPLELRLGWEGYVDVEDGASGASSPDVGVKVALLRDRAGVPDLSLLAAATLPIGEGEFTTDTFDPVVKAIAAADLTPRLGLGLNVGIGWQETGGEGAFSATHLSWSSSFGLDVGERTGAFLEYFGEWLEDGDAAHALDGGVTLLVGPGVQLDASGGFGIGGPAPEWFVGAGFAILFES